MLGKQACAVNRVPWYWAAVNCVPFYKCAVNSVALKQPVVQSNFPLLHKLGLAEKAAKDPTIGSAWLLGSFVLIIPKTFLFDLCSSWAFFGMVHDGLQGFWFLTPQCYRPKHKKKNVVFGGVSSFNACFLATPTEGCRVALRRPCYHLEMRRHMKYTPIIIKLRPREPANEVDSVR